MNRRDSAGSRQREETGQLPENVDRQGASTDLISLGKSFIASITAFAALVYAIGYLCHGGHHQMLGISQVQYPNEQIVYDGICFFILVPVCVLLSLCASWLPWVVLLLWAVALTPLQLMRRLLSRLLRGHGDRATLSTAVTLIVGLGLTVLFVFLARTVVSQKGLLLVVDSKAPAMSSTSLFTAVTSHSDHLRKLLETDRSRSLYGQLFVLGAVCLYWWVRNIAWLVGRGALSEAATTARKMWRSGILALSFYVVLLIVSLLLNLYGFLVKSNEYPLIDLKPTQAGPLPAQAFVLGHSESHSLLYWPEGPEPGIWWVDKTAHLPALQRQPMADLFKFKYEASGNSGNKGDTSGQTADKRGVLR